MNTVFDDLCSLKVIAQVIGWKPLILNPPTLQKGIISANDLFDSGLRDPISWPKLKIKFGLANTDKFILD